MAKKSLLSELVPIIHEDEHLLVVVKPAGIDVGAGPGATTGPSLIEILCALRGESEPLRVTNRLSRYESGILVFAKNTASAERIRGDLRAGKIRQEYAAVVRGKPKARRLTVTDPRAPKAGRPQPRPKKTKRASTITPSSTNTVINVITEYEKTAYVSCKTSVANTHGLRAQLRGAGHRLVGDRIGTATVRKTPHALTRLHLARISLAHPATDRKLTLAARPPENFGDPDPGELLMLRSLHAGLVRRLPTLLDRGVQACRLLTGDCEGVPGLVAEMFGPVGILQVREGRNELSRRTLLRIAQWYRRTLSLDAVYLKMFVRDRLGAAEDLAEKHTSPKPLAGSELPEEIAIREGAIQLAIRPYDGFAVGIFLDQRENRGRIRKMAADKDVLNLFAYTCGFSVAAAVGGARSTVSVDISEKSVTWGRRNFELNHLSPSEHKFIRSDATDYLRRAKRQEESFDMIVIDAPTFAHGKKRGRRFSVKDDLTSLISDSLDILRPQGVLMISTCHRRLSTRWLRDRCKEAAKGRKFRVTETPPLPPDFAVDPDHAKTIFARFE